MRFIFFLSSAGRKKSRRNARELKAKKTFPRPVAGALRPIVHPPTQRYNFKTRLGRGFTLEELKVRLTSLEEALTRAVAAVRAPNETS